MKNEDIEKSIKIAEIEKAVKPTPRQAIEKGMRMVDARRMPPDSLTDDDLDFFILKGVAYPTIAHTYNIYNKSGGLPRFIKRYYDRADILLYGRAMRDTDAKGRTCRNCRHDDNMRACDVCGEHRYLWSPAENVKPLDVECVRELVSSILKGLYRERNSDDSIMFAETRLCQAYCDLLGIDYVYFLRRLVNDSKSVLATALQARLDD